MLNMQPLFDRTHRQRIPRVVVAADGSVLAVNRSCGLVRRSEDAGVTWSDPVELESGGGNVVLDYSTGEPLIARPADARLWRSRNHGRTWQAESIEVRPNAAGHGVGDCAPVSLNCSESGITLQHGGQAR